MTQRSLTHEDVLSFRVVGDTRITPDGQRVAFTVTEPYGDRGRPPRSNVWVVPVMGGPAQQLTFGPGSDGHPRWSPEGDRLAFVSDRLDPPRQRVHLLDRAAGEPVALNHPGLEVPVAGGLDSFAWLPDGQQLAVLLRKCHDPDQETRDQRSGGVIEFEQYPCYTQLYTLAACGDRPRCVSPANSQVWEFALSADAHRVAAVVSDRPEESSWYHNRLVMFSPGRDDLTTLWQDRQRQVCTPLWTADGKAILFVASCFSDRQLYAGALFAVDIATARTRPLCENAPFSLSRLQFVGQDLIAVGYANESALIVRIDVDTGDHETIWRQDASFGVCTWPQFSVDQTGTRFTFAREAGDAPPEVWLARRDRERMQFSPLTDLNHHVGQFQISPPQTVEWRSAEGWPIEGLFIRPMGTGPEPGPMVTVVHGGPTFLWCHQYFARRGWIQLLAAAGIGVFLPNPRGSTGKGLAFAQSNIGDLGGGDWSDIQRGIDHCVACGLADPDRLGIAGSSYGGFMTAWAVTQTQRFKAAMAVAGITDWRSFHGRSTLHTWDVIHLGGADPWEPGGLFETRSPIHHVKQVTTPTLLLHGDCDELVPVEQSHLFHRALKDLGVATELVVYPGAGHGIRDRKHILDRDRRICAWFRRYLIDTA